MRFQPADPGFEARVRASFGRQAAMKLIGATLARVEPGVAVIELPHRADLTQQHGLWWRKRPGRPASVWSGSRR